MAERPGDGFLGTAYTLADGFATFEAAAHDPSRVPTALDVLDAWLDALILATGHHEATMHVAALKDAVTELSEVSEAGRMRAVSTVESRLAPLRGRLKQIDLDSLQ